MDTQLEKDPFHLWIRNINVNLKSSENGLCVSGHVVWLAVGVGEGVGRSNSGGKLVDEVVILWHPFNH